MKWKDKPALNKIAEIMMVLGVAAYFGLSYMRAKGGAVPEGLPQVCIGVVLLSLSFSYWKIKKKTAILYLALGVVWFLFAALYFFGIFG